MKVYNTVFESVFKSVGITKWCVCEFVENIELLFESSDAIFQGKSSVVLTFKALERGFR